MKIKTISAQCVGNGSVAKATVGQCVNGGDILTPQCAAGAGNNNDCNVGNLATIGCCFPNGNKVGTDCGNGNDDL